MAVQETRTLPAQFIEDLGKDYAKQLTWQLRNLLMIILFIHMMIFIFAPHGMNFSIMK